LSKTYRLLKLHADSYQEFSDNYVDLPVEHIDLPEGLSELQLSQNFEKIEVPTVVFELAKDFSRLYPEVEYGKIISLIGASQNLYLNYRNNFTVDDLLVRHFENEKKELSQLITLLKKFHFNDRNFINKLYFKNEEHNLMLKNFFVISDVYTAVINHFGLDVQTNDAFERRKQELLQNTNNLKFVKASQYAKYLIIQAFNNWLSELPVSQNKKSSYIGVFLNCCQIPIAENTSFLLSPDFEENLSEISYQAIGNFLTRPPKTNL